MALIPTSEITELKNAAELKVVADSAQEILDEQRVAHALNSAANTGAHEIMYDHEMSDSLVSKLRSKGYTVKPNKDAANPKVQWRIAGF